MSAEAASWYLILAIVFVAYTYAAYPALLALVAAWRGRRKRPAEQVQKWPRITIMVPAYNEEREIADTLESLLALDYPADRRDIIVVSDASTDRTDEIVRGFGQRGVRLIRMPQRSGKTAAENAAAAHLTGTIVVNTDASIRIGERSLKPLIATFTDPTVGLASGRDVSTSRSGAADNVGESRYVSYEMLVRALETRAGGIIGASGCFYAIRAELHRTLLPDGLSRDFAAALIARQHGYRAVSVEQAFCYVPRTSSLRREYRRKVRTMTRGMETLWAMRTLLNPFRYGVFSWMLFSHKVCRWLVPWIATGALLVLGAAALTSPLARWLSLLALSGLVLGAAGIAAADKWNIPRLLSVPAYLVMGNVAAIHAALRSLHGDRNAMWEPTRRDAKAA